MWPLTCKIKGIQNRRETIEGLRLSNRENPSAPLCRGSGSQSVHVYGIVSPPFFCTSSYPIPLSGATHELFKADGRQALQVTRSVL
jgi:hypothetical protein